MRPLGTSVRKVRKVYSFANVLRIAELGAGRSEWLLPAHTSHWPIDLMLWHSFRIAAIHAQRSISVRRMMAVRIYRSQAVCQNNI